MQGDARASNEVTKREAPTKETPFAEVGGFSRSPLVESLREHISKYYGKREEVKRG